jgi:phosphatidylinositol alpha-1,6-mannosyltransferase
MKIAIIVPYIDGPGGSGRYAEDLRKALHSRNIDCELVTVRGRSLGCFFGIWRDIRGFSVVHAIDPVPVGIYAFFAAKLRRLPFVITAQGTYAVAPLYNVKTSWLTRISYRYADAVIAISRFTRDEVLRQVAAPLSVINHGVWFRGSEASPRKKPEDLVILSVGRAKRRKGYHIALEAMALVRKARPDARYIIVGASDSPGYATELKVRADREDLRGAVEFKERVAQEELDRLYASAGIFLLPSVNESHHFEGFGLVFLEAAAAGLPSIGTSGNGIEDAVLDGKTGVLVPQNDAPAIAAAVEKIWNEWERMSAASQAFASRRNWHDVAGEYESLYRKILARQLQSV